MDAPTGARIHADADRDYLVITGGDGFRAVFSLAETDRSVQRHAVILADKMDGAPLTPHDAPYRIVVDGDQKPARSVYAVTKIEVKVLPFPRTATACLPPCGRWWRAKARGMRGRAGSCR